MGLDTVLKVKGGRKSQYPIFGRPCGRIAALLLACVVRHTALRAPCTASRKRTQKRYFDYFRLPKLALDQSRGALTPALPGGARNSA